jgi:NADH-quinone oxidoreductase subunit H
MINHSTVVTYLSDLLNIKPSLAVAFAIYFLVGFIFVNILALIGGLGTYAERKISADMQARMGPNRVGPYGILQFLADGLKMMMKEDIFPTMADKFLYNLAPLLCMVGVFATVAVLPFSSGLALSHLNVGVVYLIGISSLIGLGVFLGGYASNSKWSMLGGMRGASQIVSYEIPVSLSLISIIILAGGLSFKTIVEAQTGSPLGWFVFHNPFAFSSFVIYFIGSLAEANRAPFDLPEAESELVSGFHTEYSGMKFAFFALAEYVEVFVLSAVAAAVFLGGYKLPFGLEEWLGQRLHLPLLVDLFQVGVFFLKSLSLYYFVIVVRWTLPRLRVDQLMTICWKYLTPMAMVNILGCALWIYFFGDQSLTDLVVHLLTPKSGGGH